MSSGFGSPRACHSAAAPTMLVIMIVSTLAAEPRSDKACLRVSCFTADLRVQTTASGRRNVTDQPTQHRQALA